MLPKKNRKRKSKLSEMKLGEDRAVLMICMGIALVFWLLVKLSQIYATEKRVEFDFEVPQDQAFRIAPPNDMRVEVEGTGWNLMFDYFSHPTIRLTFDMRARQRLELNRSQLRNEIQQRLSSRDLRIVDLNYENVLLLLEKKIEKRVPVKLNLKLSLAPEYHLRDSVAPQPDSVTLTGPSSQVSILERWPTDSLSLRNLKNSQTPSIPLQKPPREIQLSQKRVEAIIRVEPYTEKTVFVPVQVRNAPDSFKIFPPRVKVTCVVGLSSYNEIDSSDFELEADMADVAINEKRKSTVALSLIRQPEFVKRVSYSPKFVEFFIIEPQSEEADSEN